ncbi:Calcium/calmodulin-regulated receptor-like kinase 1, partial [Cucurbita argyrosperma subsp. argyrosperma]
MKEESTGLIIGISIGVVIGVLLAILALFCFRYHRKRLQIGNSSSRRAANVPIRTNGADACSILSDSTVAPESPVKSSQNGISSWLDGFKKSCVISSGMPEYSFKDLQKATGNFTSVIGQGAFGPVYKATLPSGETVAVKVLATNSKQGEKEFQTEVMLLGRLHHRNLVNLIGYCAERGEHMLVYVYMSKGSLASHLYSDKNGLLSWNVRVRIALDVARGLEYLHDGAVPPVIHRDIKSANILLDQSMRARKSDVYSFGVLLFEIIAGRNPQQGLMEYVELAAMNSDGKVGWEELVDSRLDGNFDAQELNEVAALAYKSINRVPKKRPSMRDNVQVLSRILKQRQNNRFNQNMVSTTRDEIGIDVDQVESRSPRIPMPEHQRQQSTDSTAESFDV